MVHSQSVVTSETRRECQYGSGNNLEHPGYSQSRTQIYKSLMAKWSMTGSRAATLMKHIFVCFPNSYIKTLTANGMILGGGAFGRYIRFRWGHEVNYHDGTNVLIRRERNWSSLSAMHWYKKSVFWKPEGCLHKTQDLPRSRCWDSQLPKAWEVPMTIQ